jgi:hypothetical protein
VNYISISVLSLHHRYTRFTCLTDEKMTRLHKSLNPFSAAKESLLFGLNTILSAGGSLWLRVASMNDTQRVRYARNFAVDNVTVGFGVAF